MHESNDGYVEWWGSYSSFYYEAKPSLERIQDLVRIWRGPLDFDIPYV